MRLEYRAKVHIRNFNGNPASTFTLQWNSNGIMGFSSLVQFYGALGGTLAFYRFKVANDAKENPSGGECESSGRTGDKHSTEIL